MRALSCGALRLVALALGVAVSLAPLRAEADSPYAIDSAEVVGAGGGDGTGGGGGGEAREAYAAGSDAYALGNYEQAVGHFEQAYTLSKEPALLFNLGQAYTRWYDIDSDLEHLYKARRLYENYVLNIGMAELDQEAEAQARSDAQRRIAEVDRRIAQHEAAGEQGEPERDEGGEPVTKKGWFWGVVVGGAALVAGGITAGVLLSRPSSTFEPELGTIGGRAPRPAGLTLRF